MDIFPLIRNGEIEKVRLLLKKGANPNMIDERSQMSLLHTAVDNNKIDMVNLLLEYKADPTIPDNQGITPIHHCAKESHLRILASLIRHGVNVNIPDEDGWTPLHYASYNNNVAVIYELLRSHAKVVKNKNGNYPWDPLGDDMDDNCEIFFSWIMRKADVKFYVLNKLLQQKQCGILVGAKICSFLFA